MEGREYATPVALAEALAVVPGLIHELRHPLAGAMMAAQLLEKDLGGPLREHGDWQLIRQQLTRLGEMLRTWQEWLTPRADDCGEFELRPVVDHIVALLNYRLKRLGPSFQLDCPERAVAWGSAGALLHALSNLVVNALDALEEAGGDGRLAVRVLPGDSRVEVRVSDEGPGIPPEKASHIFDSRFTTKTPDRGSGLGLSLARRLLMATTGSVRLVTPWDPGRLDWAHTEFCVSLPRRRPSPLAAPAQGAPTHPPETEGPPGPASGFTGGGCQEALERRDEP